MRKFKWKKIQQQFTRGAVCSFGEFITFESEELNFQVRPIDSTKRSLTVVPFNESFNSLSNFGVIILFN